MKQYEKIYLPERQEGARAFRDNQGDVPVVMHGSVIVLSIEELREIWDKGYVCGCEEVEAKKIVGDSTLGIFPTTAQNFHQFIESKGIKLDANG